MFFNLSYLVFEISNVLEVIQAEGLKMEATATTEIFLKMIEEPSPEPVPTPTPFSPGGVINGVQTGDPFSIFVFIMSLLIVLTLICFFI